MHLVAVVVALVAARSVELQRGSIFYAAASLVLLFGTPLASLFLRHKLDAVLQQTRPSLALR